MKKILFVASEAVPFIKTGGLADVVGSLPKYLDKRYFDARVILPKYMCMKEEIRNSLEYIGDFYIDYAGSSKYVGVLKKEVEGVTFYFIDNEEYFGGPKPYGDWLYDIEKFIFFSFPKSTNHLGKVTILFTALFSSLRLIKSVSTLINCNC